MRSAAILEHAGSADDDVFGGVEESDGVDRFAAADRAGRCSLDDLVGLDEESGHFAEGFVHGCPVEPGEDDIGVSCEELHDGVVEASGEEVGLVEGDDIGAMVQEIGGCVDGEGGVCPLIVGGEVGGVVAVVEAGLEGDDGATGFGVAGEPADEFGGLSGEHGPADDGEAGWGGGGWGGFRGGGHGVAELRVLEGFVHYRLFPARGPPVTDPIRSFRRGEARAWASEARHAWRSSPWEVLPRSRVLA